MNALSLVQDFTSFQFALLLILSSTFTIVAIYVSHKQARHKTRFEDVGMFVLYSITLAY